MPIHAAWSRTFNPWLGLRAENQKAREAAHFHTCSKRRRERTRFARFD
jgi:hypothetical protein